jgi:lipopolysaccharide export system protein LptA
VDPGFRRGCGLWIIRKAGLAAPWLALLLHCSAALPAAAQPGAAAAGQDQNVPIQIQADSGIEWQQEAHVYIARGNAVASRGTSEVHADTLIAHYREIKGGSKPASADGKGGAAALGGGTGNTEIYRVEAEGHVLLKRDAQTVVGDHAIYDVDKGVAVITGKNLKLTTATDTVTARDSLEWFDQKQVAVARGDAVATRNGKTVKGDILTAYMVKSATPPGKPGSPGPHPAAASTGKPDAKAPGQESKISRVDAQGHVVITNGLDVGRGDFGVYNAETGIATLIRNVVIERGKDVIRGQRGVIDLNHNVSRMLPGGGPGTPHQRVQGLFVREDKNGHGGKAETSKAGTASKTGREQR